jgi:hypothetical protein
MTWSPVTTVTIAGVDYTGDTVGVVSLNRGRDNVYADPSAGFASVQLIDRTGDGFTIDPTAELRITVAKSDTTAVPLFVGNVTDITSSLFDAGIAQTAGSITTVTAVGPLARASRRLVLPDGRAAETDGERIAAALAEALGTTWEELPYTTWASIPADVTWATLPGQYDPDYIDAGVFDIVALPAQAGGHDALTVALEASRSGQGVLYERGDGFIAWANADERATATNYYDLEPELLQAANLETFTSAADIVNVVEVTYDGGTASAQDDDSIPTYGRWQRRIETLLVNETNGQQYADAWISRHAYPTVNLRRVTVRLDGLPDTTADDLLDLDINSAITVQNLPRTLGIVDLPGFVEGVEWRIDPYRAEVSYLISDANLSTGDLRWAQLPATLEWADLDAMLEWQDWR